MVRSLVHSEPLGRVVRQIVERWHPERVILFGSHAYGTPTVDSDADLMSILRTDEPPLRAAAGIAASRPSHNEQQATVAG